MVRARNSGLWLRRKVKSDTKEQCCWHEHPQAIGLNALAPASRWLIKLFSLDCSGDPASRRTSSHNKMQDQGYHCKDKKQVDQATRNVEHSETPNPRDQQNHKQYCPDAHLSLLYEASTRTQSNGSSRNFGSTRGLAFESYPHSDEKSVMLIS
jgi:hypothetical protein